MKKTSKRSHLMIEMSVHKLRAKAFYNKLEDTIKILLSLSSDCLNNCHFLNSLINQHSTVAKFIYKNLLLKKVIVSHLLTRAWFILMFDRESIRPWFQHDCVMCVQRLKFYWHGFIRIYLSCIRWMRTPK